MKNWIINSQHHSNSHADCWTMRGIFPPVSFFFFYFYPHTEGLHQCPVFFPKCDPMKQWIYRGYTPTKTTHKVSTSHCPSLPKKNILKKHCKYDYSKNQTKQHQQKKIIIIKKERVHDYFPPPSVVDKVHIVSRHGLVTISAHAVAQTLKTEREERGRRGEAGGFENITQAACQTCVNPSGANIDKWSGPFWS